MAVGSDSWDDSRNDVDDVIRQAATHPEPLEKFSTELRIRSARSADVPTIRTIRLTNRINASLNPLTPTVAIWVQLGCL